MNILITSPNDPERMALTIDNFLVNLPGINGKPAPQFEMQVDRDVAFKADGHYVRADASLIERLLRNYLGKYNGLFYKKLEVSI